MTQIDQASAEGAKQRTLGGRSPDGSTAPDLFARYLDDIEVGDSFTTKGRTVTEADIVNFAALTWDTYPLHVDAEWASKTIFGERIAHGMLVLSFAAGLIPMEPGPIVAFYGMEKVRFFAPTKIGDTIRVYVELKEKEERDDTMGLATFHQAVLNQRDETVCKSITKVLLKRRADA